jgi:hypothetical protein
MASEDHGTDPRMGCKRLGAVKGLLRLARVETKKIKSGR